MKLELNFSRARRSRVVPFRAAGAFATAFACVVASGLTGCQSAQVGEPLTNTVGGNDPDQQMEFLHRLADRKVASNDEAFHAVLMFLDGQDPANDYGGRVAVLRQRKMLPGGFNEPADHALERGTLAVALVRGLSIRGGVTMSVLGPNPRYATRELQYLDIYPPSSPNQTLRGSELLSILSRAEDYQRSHKLFKQPTVPTGRPQGVDEPSRAKPIS